MRELSLETGQIALIDEEDFDKVSPYKWRITHQGYAHAVIFSGNAGRGQVLLHRFIVTAAKGDIVDHINGNVLDCRKNNLRVVNASINGHNRQSINKNNTSGYSGVIKRKNKWLAIIKINRKQHRLGLYDCPQKAHEAYLKAKNKILHE